MKDQATFYGMPVRHLPPLRLRLQFGMLILLPLQLLYPLVVVVDGNTQDLLRALLADDELIQVLFQRYGRDSGRAHDTGAPQWAAGRLAWLVYASEALAGEV